MAGVGELPESFCSALPRWAAIWLALTLVCGCYPSPGEQFDSFIAQARARATADASLDDEPLETEDGGWPPPMESLYRAGEGCVLPTCEESGEPGLDISGTWQRRLTTTASSCGDLVQRTNPQAIVGHVEEEQTPPLARVAGSCGYDEQGSQIATIVDGVVCSCESNEQMMGVVSYEIAVVTYSEDGGSGGARVYLVNVPDVAGGDCEIELEVAYERQ